MKKVSSVNYKLQLLKNSKLHLVFYISLLELAKKNTLIVTDVEIQPENNIIEFEVEAILDQRLISR